MKSSVLEIAYRFCPTCTHRLKRANVDNQFLLTCAKCGFVFWNNPKPSVSTLIHTSEGILMLKRAKEPLKGYWCLPGGFISYYESSEQAAMRETKEETGANFHIDSLVGVFLIDKDPRGMHHDIIYSGTITGKINLSDEHTDLKFFDPHKLPQKIAYSHRKAITQWLNSKQ